MKIQLGVIFGGDTVEHEVSIITAVQAMENMDQNKYDIIPIYISKDRTWYTGKMLMDIDIYKNFNDLKKYAKKVALVNNSGKFQLQTINKLFRRTVATLDLAFPIVHGKGAEDGSLQGYLDSIGIPYVGSNVLGSALGQDKVVLKQVLESNNISVPKYTWFYDYEYINKKDEIIKNIEKLGYPVIIKPACLGSSVGITVVKDKKGLDSAINEAIKYETKIVVEEMIQDLVEVDCAVLGNYENQEVSLTAEMLTNNDFLTFQDKYLSSGKGKLKGGKGLSNKGNMSNSSFNIPANIDNKLIKEVEDLSLKTFRALNLSGVARIDFLIDKKQGKVYVNEPNTIPGSLAFYMFKPKGIEYKTLLDNLINYSIKDYKNKSKKISSFESNVLSSYSGSKGCKKLNGIK